VGRLAIRLILKDLGVRPGTLNFDTTAEGKPYLVRIRNIDLTFRLDSYSQSTPEGESTIHFNIAHDNRLIAVAFNSKIPPYKIGVDVMKVQIPQRETFLSFVRTLSSQVCHFSI
jgi:4'-phosphopantetheinyl transferase